MADTLSSGGSEHTLVRVQIPFPAPLLNTVTLKECNFYFITTLLDYDFYKHDIIFL